VTGRFLIGLTVLNFALLLGILFSRTEPLLATGSQQVIRGRALEIVDDRGRVRASIKVQADPEIVMLRLIDPNGRPEVKIGASVKGGGLSLVGDSDATQVLLHADGAESSLRLRNEAGREHVLRP
jgi:hypothetical protein